MVRIVLFIVLVSTVFVYGNENIPKTSSLQHDINQTEIGKELVIQEYTEALKFYKDKEYQTSYNLFNELFLKNLNNVNINFYLGRSAYEIGLFDDAILAYDRILFENPDALRVKFELGRTYIAKENYQEGQKIFKSLTQETTVPIDLQKIYKKYLDLCEEKISKHKMGGAFIVGIGYDSNINNSSKNDYFDYPLLGVVQNTTPKKSATFHQEVGVLNYGYQLEDRYLLKVDGLVFLKSMFQNDLDDKKIKMGSIAPALNHYYQENLFFEYGVFFDNLWVGGENYIQSYGVNPKATYQHSSSETIGLQMKYQIKNYQQNSNKPKDSIYKEILGNYTLALNEKWGTISSLKLFDERKQSGNLEDVANHGYEFALAGSYTYRENMIGNPSMTYKKTLYDTKSEDQYIYKLGATYLYSPSWIIQGDGSYTIQDATDQTSQYNKYNLNINLIRSF